MYKQSKAVVRLEEIRNSRELEEEREGSRIAIIYRRARKQKRRSTLTRKQLSGIYCITLYDKSEC